jgi:hypothetical protein
MCEDDMWHQRNMVPNGDALGEHTSRKNHCPTSDSDLRPYRRSRMNECDISGSTELESLDNGALRVVLVGVADRHDDTEFPEVSGDFDRPKNRESHNGPATELGRVVGEPSRLERTFRSESLEERRCLTAETASANDKYRAWRGGVGH